VLDSLYLLPTCPNEMGIRNFEDLKMAFGLSLIGCYMDGGVNLGTIGMISLLAFRLSLQLGGISRRGCWSWSLRWGRPHLHYMSYNLLGFDYTPQRIRKLGFHMIHMNEYKDFH
jgi:hypothetical protein